MGFLLFSLNFQPVSPGLDASWVFAMNYYAHGPELFGKDLVFTYGPLAYLAVPENVGSNLITAAAVHVVVWCVLLYLLLKIGEGSHRASAVLFLTALICSNRLYFLYWDYLLVIIVMLAIILLMKRPGNLFVLGILATMTGIEFLIKFSGFILIALLLAIYVASRLSVVKQTGAGERTLLSLAVLAGPVGYLIYNPSISGLTGYIRGSWNIASGYSASMSLDAEKLLLWNAAILCVALASFTGFSLWKGWITVAGAAMVTVTAWVAFKHGYVRGGAAHAGIFFCLMIMAGAFLVTQIEWARSRLAPFLVPFICFVGFSLYCAGGVFPVWNVSWWAPSYNLRQTAHLFAWRKMTVMLEAMSDKAFKNSVVNEYSSQLGQSRVLFFPWDSSYGSRGSFHSVPIYTTQAYSAYTHYLDDKVAEHITGASPPIDYVLLEWKDVDTRNPFVDVPATWNALFGGFEPVAQPGEALLLKPRSPTLPITFQEIGPAACRFNDWIDVPTRSTPVAVSLDLPVTLLGKTVTMLYHLEPISMEVRTKYGVTVLFRFLPDTASFPFPINYLPLNIPLLHQLWRENRIVDPIVAFRFVGPGVPFFDCGGIRFYDVLGTAVRVG